MSRLRLVLTSFGWSRENSLFEPLELALEGGVPYALLGPSGAGKSSLIELLAGLHPDPLGGGLEGVLELDGEDITAFDSDRRVATLGYVGENPRLFLTGLVRTVEEELQWSLKALGWDGKRRREAVEAALERFDLQDLRQRHPQQLSGGQQQLVALASVWARSPKWLLLDEPTCSLDPEAESIFTEAVRGLVAEGAGLLWASARPESVAWCAERFWLSRRTGAVRLGREPEPALRGFDAPPVELRTSGETAPPTDETPVLLEAESLLVRPQRDAAIAVRVESLRLMAGEAVGLVGPNGSGKSTLARALRGALPREGGWVRCCGEPIEPGELAASADRIAYVEQNPEALFVARSVRSELLYASELMGRGFPEAERWSERAVDLFGLEPWLPYHPRELPAAVRTLLGTALAMLTGARVLIFDEPSARLDPAASRIWEEALRVLLGEGRAALLIDHREEWLETVVSRCLRIRDGVVSSCRGEPGRGGR